MHKIEKRFFICLGVYLILHIAFRMLISNSLEIDEAEMVLWFQAPLRLGYNSQPPLYYWLQAAFFYIFGLNIFSLALLKNILIFLTYFFLYKSAKEFIDNQIYAIFSVTSLFLVYNFSWVLHKDLTHSVLLMALCSITLYLFIRLLDTKSIRYYLLFGIFSGLGILAKYNYVIFIAAFILAALSAKDYRGVLFDKKMPLALLLVFLICLPHLSWCLGNLNYLLIDKTKLNMASGRNPAFALRGLYILARESVFFLLPLLAVYLLLFRQGFKKALSAGRQDDNKRCLLERFFLFFLLISISLIIGYNITDVKVRWALPFLFLFPLYFFIRMKDMPIAAWKAKVFIFLSVFFAAAVLFSVPLRIALASLRHKYGRLNYPYDELSGRIKKEYFQKGVILTADYVTGADLKINFKDSFVLSADPKIALKPLKDIKKLLVVWDEQRPQDAKILKSYIARNLGLYFESKDSHGLRALYKYSKDKSYHIRFLVLDKEAGG